MSSQEIARKISGRREVDHLFARNSLVSVVDHRIPDNGYRILALLAACSFDKPARLTFEEVGFAVGCSARQAIRQIKELERLKYICIHRKRNHGNEYRLAPQPTVTAPEPRGLLVICACGRKCKAVPCRNCRLDRRVERTSRRVAREEIAAAVVS